VAKLYESVETEAHAKAISTLCATGPGASRKLVDGAEEGGDPALAAALPGGGLTTMALRDVQIARLLGALWNTSIWGSEPKVERNFVWREGVKNAAVGMESGVWYAWPARVLPGAGSDVQDQPWYGRAIDNPGKLIITREYPCPEGCVGENEEEGGGFMAAYHMTVSLAFTDLPAGFNASTGGGGDEDPGAPVSAVAPTMGVMMVSYAAKYFSEKLFLEMHGVCSHGATCFLMDEQAYIIAHPQLSHSPLETAQASGKRERMVNDTVRRAVGDANSAIFGYPRMRRPMIADNAGVFVGDLHGAVAAKLLTLQLLVQRTTKGNTPQKNGMVYEINTKLLAARGGEISGIVTRPELMEFVVREVPGTNVVLVVLLNKGEAQGAVQRAKEYCGTFSNQCPDVQAPWAAVTEMGDTDLEELVNTCNSEVVRGAGAARTCPVRADYIATQLWQSNASSGLRSQIRAARVASGQQVCRTQLEESLNTIIIAVVLASVGGAALFITRMQAKKLKQKQLAETRAYTDLLHQPIKEVSECATLLRDECHRVIGAARSFYDFEYLIDEDRHAQDSHPHYPPRVRHGRAGGGRTQAAGARGVREAAAQED
jgi:hypothetical protein